MRGFLARLAGRLRTPTIRQIRNATLQDELKLIEGFHGDQYLLELAGFLLKRSEAFIETGTLAGTTSSYVGGHFPTVRVYSCEPDPQSCSIAQRRCHGFPQVRIENEASPEFLYRLFEREPRLASQRLLFWLDAHGYGFRWPILEELQFITSRLESAIIMIDDFKIPGRPEFGFDAYDGQECSLEYISPALDLRHEYRLIMPTYSERTSRVHGLRGVGTIVYGQKGLELPEELKKRFKDDRLVQSTAR